MHGLCVMDVAMRKLIARTEDHTVNGLNLALAGILFLSPWLFGFATHQTAAWNAWLSAAVIAVVAAVALAQLHQWEEWVNALVGLWVAASPWLLGFAALANPMWTHLLIGLAVAALAAYELWRLNDETRATTV
jgi:SPW repeat